MSKNKPKTQQQTNNVIRQAQSKTEITKPFLANRKAEWILVLFTFILFANTFWNSYALDDDFAITENQYVQQGIKGIPAILTHPYIVVRGKGVDYRPVSAITFAVENSLFGANPHISHILNVVLFIAIVLLLFYCLKNIWLVNVSNAQATAFFICLLYASHPVHTEVVDSLKNREELLAFFFALLWFISFHMYFENGKWKWLIGSYLFLVLSLISKAVALPFFFLGLFWFWWFENRKCTRFYIASAITVFVNIIYVIANISYSPIRQIFDLENPLIGNDTFLNRLGMCMDSLACYVRLMMVPNPLSFYYGYNTIPLESIFSLKPFLIFLLCTAILAYAFIMLKNKDIRGYFVIMFFSIFAFYSNLFVIYTGIVAERTLFQSSLFFIGLLVVLANKIPIKIRSTVFIAFCAVFSVLTIKRNFEWKDTLTLMSSDISHLENSTLANYFYAGNLLHQAIIDEDSLAKANRINEAEKYIQRTLIISPQYTDAYLTKGRIAQYYQGNLDSAIHYYEIANNHNTNPDNTELFYELGRAYCIKFDFVKAMPFWSNMYRIMPTDTNVLYFYSRCLYNTGQKDEGFAINRRLMKLHPEFSFGYLNEGWLYELSGNKDSTAFYYEKAAALGNKDSYILNFLENYSRK